MLSNLPPYLLTLPRLAEVMPSPGPTAELRCGWLSGGHSFVHLGWSRRSSWLACSGVLRAPPAVTWGTKKKVGEPSFLLDQGHNCE